MGANGGHSEQRANEQVRTAWHPNAQRPRGIHRSHTYVPFPRCRTTPTPEPGGGACAAERIRPAVRERYRRCPDLQYLLFRLSISSQRLKLSQPQVYHPIQLARVSHGASPLPSCDPAPRALIHARMGRSLSFTYTSMNMYSTPPWTLSSNSAANGGRGGRPRAPRAARPSQA